MDKDNRFLSEAYSKMEALLHKSLHPDENDRVLLHIFKDNNIEIDKEIEPSVQNIHGVINIDPETGEPVSQWHAARHNKKFARREVEKDLISLYVRRIGNENIHNHPGLANLPSARIEVTIAPFTDAHAYFDGEKVLKSPKKFRWDNIQKPGWEEWLVDIIEEFKKFSRYMIRDKAKEEVSDWDF